MRRFLASTIMAAAVGAGLASLPAHAQLSTDKPATTAAAQKGPQADVPVKVVVLFSSGVGYFEHAGSVTGNASTELRFKTNQVNDILKSLVLQDLGGGRATTVVYPSQDPIEKTLRSFQVDITGDPSLAALLGQLRGARVQVSAGGENIDGTILGLEERPKAVGEKGSINVWVMNLISGGTIRSVELAEAKRIELEDPQLREELAKALAALAQARDQDKKPVTLNFTGAGERQVKIGYVVETPVWKTSYRLILPGDGADKANDKPKLVGWAIVENQTDNDWGNVQLSLVSGRPISFIQDLYRPLYVPRPVVQPELYASLRPQTYEAGMARDEKALAGDIDGDGATRAGRESVARKSALAERQRAGAMAKAPQAASGTGLNAEFAGAGGGGGALGGLALADSHAAYKPMEDFSKSVASLASASRVGELFQYTVGNVSLPRQRSAMIPIVTDDVEVERLSIYNPSVMPRNPLYGARVKNTTGKHLLQGPVTVLDGPSYAGDARIDNVPPGQERLISYGVDLQVLVDAKNNKREDSIVAGKIVKGVLWVTHKNVVTQDYAAENKADKDKTLIVEHPLRGPGWKLIEPVKPLEKTDAVYRFRAPVAAGKSASIRVVEEQVAAQQISILSTDVGPLEVYGRTGTIPKAVRDVLADAVARKNALADTQRQIEERRRQVAEITAEQVRIRENLKSIDRNSDYGIRLLKKLNDQESAIEALQSELTSLTKTSDQQRKDLESFLLKTNVGEP
jgi:hypothetical protein